MSRYKNILIIRSGGMGDIIFITPALHIVRTNFPEAKISLLISPCWIDILKGNKDVDQVIENPYEPFYNIKGFEHILKSSNFDLIINFDPLKEYNYRVWPDELKIKSIWGLVNHNSSLADFSKYNFQDLILIISDPKKHNVENCLSLLVKAGLEVNFNQLIVNIDKQDETSIDSLFNDYAITSDGPLIVIHPGTSSSNCTIFQNLFGRIRLLSKRRLPVDRKRWPTKYYAQLVGLLHEEMNVRVIITGSKYEAALAQQISKQSNSRIIDLCGKTTIRQLAALYKRCNVLVCSDTGPIHLAAAVNTPVVGLYGGYTDPAHTRPWMEESRVKIIQSDFECAPCKNTKRKKICWRANCIRQIRPETVFRTIKELIFAKDVI